MANPTPASHRSLFLRPHQIRCYQPQLLWSLLLLRGDFRSAPLSSEFPYNENCSSLGSGGASTVHQCAYVTCANLQQYRICFCLTVKRDSRWLRFTSQGFWCRPLYSYIQHAWQHIETQPVWTWSVWSGSVLLALALTRAIHRSLWNRQTDWCLSHRTACNLRYDLSSSFDLRPVSQSFHSVKINFKIRNCNIWNDVFIIDKNEFSRCKTM